MAEIPLTSLRTGDKQKSLETLQYHLLHLHYFITVASYSAGHSEIQPHVRPQVTEQYLCAYLLHTTKGSTRALSQPLSLGHSYSANTQKI